MKRCYHHFQVWIAPDFIPARWKNHAIEIGATAAMIHVIEAIVYQHAEQSSLADQDFGFPANLPVSDRQISKRIERDFSIYQTRDLLQEMTAHGLFEVFELDNLDTVALIPTTSNAVES